jgi:hypothetical protein
MSEKITGLDNIWRAVNDHKGKRDSLYYRVDLTPLETTAEQNAKWSIDKEQLRVLTDQFKKQFEADAKANIEFARKYPHPLPADGHKLSAMEAIGRGDFVGLAPNAHAILLHGIMNLAENTLTPEQKKTVEEKIGKQVAFLANGYARLYSYAIQRSSPAGSHAERAKGSRGGSQSKGCN